MGLELMQGYHRDRRDLLNNSMSAQSGTASGDYLINRTDLMLDKLNRIERELDSIKAQMENNSKNLDSFEDNLDTVQQQLAEKMRTATKISCQYTSDLVKDLDSSMDMLASQRSIQSLNKLLTATCAISIFNLASIIIILLFTFHIF